MAIASSTPKRHRKRLRTRIIASVLAIGTLLSVLFAAFALFLRANLEERIIDRVLAKEVASYAHQFLHTPKDTVIEYALIKGRTFSERRFANVPLPWRELTPGVHRLVEESSTGRVAYKLAVHKEPGYWFFLQYDVTAEERTRRVVTVAIVASVAVFSALALLLGFWSSSRIMSPVTELALRISRMGRRDAVARLAPDFADDEVGQLASALDDYAQRLTQLVERDREFNSDVSHELRTPLAVIQSATELLVSMPELSPKARERLQRIERSAKQSTELITALLHLSRGEKQVPSTGEHTSVDALIAHVVESHKHQLKNKPVQVELKINSALSVAAPESVLSVVLGNLIGNAFKYTREGVVQVIVSGRRVTVDDSGPGIAEEERERVFERHYRAAGTTGSGAGLGLAIVQRLCELYGWQVQLAPREPHGIRAVLDFGEIA